MVSWNKALLCPVFSSIHLDSHDLCDAETGGRADEVSDKRGFTRHAANYRTRTRRCHFGKIVNFLLPFSRKFKMAGIFGTVTCPESKI